MRAKFYIYSAMLVLLGFSVGSNAATTTNPVPAPSISTQVDTPTGVHVFAGYRKVVISWNPVIAPIRYYRVEASTNGGTKWYAGPVTRATSISLSQPNKNTLTMYRVVAVGYKELSLTSEIASITIK